MPRGLFGKRKTLARRVFRSEALELAVVVFDDLGFLDLVRKLVAFGLAGEDAGSKMRKATELGITVINEDRFDEMIK